MQDKIQDMLFELYAKSIRFDDHSKNTLDVKNELELGLIDIQKELDKIREGE